MADSKTALQLENALHELMMVPPNSPCATEVLQIVEEIGGNLTGRSEKTQKLLVKFKNIQRNNKWEEWFDYYLRGKLGGR